MVDESRLRSASILIVDDQAANVTLLEMMLADAGYTNVSSTRDAREVCELHRKHRYDLILLDLQMPLMDGFQVIEDLCAAATDAFLPVLVVTAQPGHKLKALRMGVRDFISKPVDLVEVRMRIRNMLEVRLLYSALEHHARDLEAVILERTAELRKSEARFRSLSELASDWYWEQDEQMHFTRVSGPVLEMFGLPVQAPSGEVDPGAAGAWNSDERHRLSALVAARQPFLDLALSRTQADGSSQTFHVSGQPMFDQTCRFVGYQGIGVELPAARRRAAVGLKRS